MVFWNTRDRSTLGTDCGGGTKQPAGTGGGIPAEAQEQVPLSRLHSQGALERKGEEC